MKAYVTGATGFVGKNLVDFLTRQGVEVKKHRRGAIIGIEVDKDTDFIFHCAAELYDENEMIASNIQLTHDLLESTKEINYKKLIYIGSSSEFDLECACPISENSPIKSSNLYTLTKTAGAELCRLFSIKYEKPITIVRPFSPYGPHENKRKLIPTIYNNSLRSEFTQIGAGMHDWIYIDDFVNALWNIATFSYVGFDTVNIGTGRETSNGCVAYYMKSLLGDECRLDFINYKISKYDRERWYCDTRYAEIKYDFKAKITLEEGLKRYVEWRHSKEPA